MSSSHNRNPQGLNQHAPVPSAEDPTLAAALNKYHREGITSNEKISKRLLVEYNITCSASSVKRRRAELELYGPRSKKQNLSKQQKEQIVLQQLDRDSAQGQGLSTVKNHIAYTQGVLLSRDDISEIMHVYAPEGFLTREPGAKRIVRISKTPLGIHERWAMDGHDKMCRIGFPIWGIVDDAQGAWLILDVLPSNRLGDVVGYTFLCTVEKFRGLPIQLSSDCGSETTQIYGLMNALNEIFDPDWDNKELAPHVYMRSVHNISIERSWLRLRLDIGDNIVLEFEKGPPSGDYNPEIPLHKQLSDWLWSQAIQSALNEFMAMRNAHHARKDNSKSGPSGCARNDSFLHPTDYGLKNCLRPLTDEQLATIKEIKEHMGGEGLVAFVKPEFAARAKKAYYSLHITELNVHNAWYIYDSLLSVLQ